MSALPDAEASSKLAAAVPATRDHVPSRVESLSSTTSGFGSTTVEATTSDGDRNPEGQRQRQLIAEYETALSQLARRHAEQFPGFSADSFVRCVSAAVLHVASNTFHKGEPCLLLSPVAMCLSVLLCSTARIRFRCCSLCLTFCWCMSQTCQRSSAPRSLLRVSAPAKAT